jgi:putative redox protein
MTRRQAIARLDGEGLRFVATTGSGHVIAMDTADGDTAPRPAELLVVALAGCTAMDVVAILRKKGGRIATYEVEVEAEQRAPNHPHAFLQFSIRHVVSGDVAEEALRRSIELSATRYCAVGSTLASGIAELHHGYRLTTSSGEALEGEVVVTGPYEGPEELGTGSRAAGSGRAAVLARA